VRARLERAERLAHLVERVARVHERPQQAAGGEREDLLQLLARVDEGADHGVLAPEERDDVEVDHLAGVRAAGHEAPVLREGLQGLPEQLPADVLEHEVDAPAARDLGHPLRDVLRRVVDPHVHAEVGGRRELLGRARCADHVRARQMGELDGGGSDAAGDRVDEHRLTDAQAAAREEHVPRGAERDLQRARVVVGDLLGHADELRGGRDRVLREPARARDAEEDLAAEQVRHDAVADREVVDPLADRLHAADDLEALDVGEVDGEARRPLADVDVDVVQRARGDVDAHVVGARLRIVDVLDGEHVGPSELADDCGFHVASRSSRAG
jgi:hypothetical protein